MRPTRRAASTIVFLAILLTVGTSLPAAAVEQKGVDLHDAGSVLQQVAPSLIEDSHHQTELHVSPASTGSAPQVASSVDWTADTTGITLLGARPESSPSHGIRVFPTSSPDAVQYVQPTRGGMRLMTAIGSPAAPSSFAYEFDEPGAHFEPVGEGALKLVGADGVGRGMIDAAWARDSAGRSIPTSYSFDSTTLTQSVDLSDPSIAYPVVIDPNWSYLMVLHSGSTTPMKFDSAIHTCFSCLFPIAGAPRRFPTTGQILPLRVGWAGVVDMNVTCIHRSSWAYSYPTQPKRDSAGFQFDAAREHIDGLGSNIYFEVRWNGAGSGTDLEVGAFIVNDFFLGNVVYTASAKASWSQFAYNIATVR